MFSARNGRRGERERNRQIEIERDKRECWMIWYVSGPFPSDLAKLHLAPWEVLHTPLCLQHVFISSPIEKFCLPPPFLSLSVLFLIILWSRTLQVIGIGPRCLCSVSMVLAER